MSLPPVAPLPPYPTRIVPGAPLRDALLAQAKAVLATFPAPLRLVIVRVGTNPVITQYVANKLKACAMLGILAEVVQLTEANGEAALRSTLKALAHDASVHAIIVQTPLPTGWNVQEALDAVPATKDIDGLSSANIALRKAGAATAIWPATPLGITRLLAHMGEPMAGRTVAIIGQGRVVGQPMADIAKALGANTLIIDKHTPAPARLAAQADVVIAAAGAPGLVTEMWLKPIAQGGAAVVDVGLTKVDGKLTGDIARMRVEGVARFLTPSPGGVGPLTVASLLTNLVDAALLQTGRPKHTWGIPPLDSMGA